MTGLLKIGNYNAVNAIPIEAEFTDDTPTLIKFQVGVEVPSYVTAFVLVGGVMVDYKTSQESLTDGTLEVTVPTNFIGKPFSIFVFSAKDRYSNRDIGKTVWAVWFKNLQRKDFLYYGDESVPEGAVLVTVPMSGAGFNLTFTRNGDSQAAHGDVVIR